MEKPLYETIQYLSPLGIHMAFITTPGGYHPMHWHEELEILYPLNGIMDISIEGKKYQVNKKHLTVIRPAKVHSTYSYDRTAMFLEIHVLRKSLETYLPDIALYKIHCSPDMVNDKNFSQYRKICELLEDLTRLYIRDEPAYVIEAEGIVLQVLAHLLRHFSEYAVASDTDMDILTMERIRSIITYVQEHFRDPISLAQAASHIGLGREYFCRFFKKNMGMSFLDYVNEVRLSHVYHDLQYTEAPIGTIMEANGFTNQKLFNRSFKQLYHHTPSELRHTSNKISI